MLSALPRLYAILDVSCFAPPLRTTAAMVDYARDLAAGGATLIQYRSKVGSTREMLAHAREIRHVLDDGITLIMNDRADICVAADFRGVHVGQDDLSPAGARAVIGPDRILGASTHNLEQLREADASPRITSPSARSSRLLPSTIPIPWLDWKVSAPREPQPRSRWWPSAGSLAPTHGR